MKFNIKPTFIQTVSKIRHHLWTANVFISFITLNISCTTLPNNRRHHLLISGCSGVLYYRAEQLHLCSEAAPCPLAWMKSPRQHPCGCCSDSGDLGDGTCFVCLGDIVIVLQGAAFHSRVIIGVLWQQQLAMWQKAPVDLNKVCSVWCRYFWDAGAWE